MNVEELSHLASWLKKHAPEGEQKYEAVREILEHNAQKPNKLPLEDPLNDLLAYLQETPVHVLSNEQVKFLDAFNVASFFGRQGAEFVEGTIRKADFDPATAMQDMQNAVEAMTSAIERTDAINRAFQQIYLPSAGLSLEENRALVRVEFQGDASIQNVVDWKEWSEKWHDIVRGIAMSIGEAPEDVHVVGASRGSIIIDIAATYFFVHVLTGIVKAATRVAKDIVMLLHSIEDLRTKGLLNDKIENEIRAEANSRRGEGVERIVTETKELLPDELDGEQETALRKSTSQLLDFQRKGGEVDFVAPEEAPQAGGAEDGVVKQIEELRAEIEELRVEKEEVRRLTHDDS